MIRASHSRDRSPTLCMTQRFKFKLHTKENSSPIPSFTHEDLKEPN